jgi:hypothetical protein
MIIKDTRTGEKHKGVKQTITEEEYEKLTEFVKELFPNVTHFTFQNERFETVIIPGLKLMRDCVFVFKVYENGQKGKNKTAESQGNKEKEIH